MLNSVPRLILIAILILGGVFSSRVAEAQRVQNDEEGFGPVVTAYLGYLRNEQEVVDDRVSRREITRAYYVRNSNRIRALRQIAIRLARESHNDYLPELEAVAREELSTLFEHPPKPEALHVGEVLANKFRFLGPVRAGELFYMFARLDPYEQAERLRANGGAANRESVPDPKHPVTTTRPRRVVP